jgi:hypothetical protein
VTSLRIPGETLPKTSWRRIPLDIFGSILLLVCINFFTLWYLGNFTLNYGYWTIHQKWNLLANLRQPVDWLILGDSSCNQGVVPRIIENELGETAVNLCTIGNLGVVNDLWMLEEYIDRFGPPGNVLIVHVYDVWHRNIDPVLFGQVPRPWGFWSHHSLGQALFEDQKVRENTFLEHYVPIYSQTRAIKTILRSVVTFQHNPLVPRWHIEADGFLVAREPHPEVVFNGAIDHIQFASQNSFRISTLNDVAMQKLVELADSYRFNVYLVNSPVFEGLYIDPNYQAYLSDVQAKLAEFDSDSQFVFHIDEVRTFPADLMQNPDHLILPGAEIYTNWLIEQIRQIRDD